MKNKKGSIIDVIFIAVTLFVFIIAALIGYQILDDWQNTGNTENPDFIAFEQDMKDRYPKIFDNLFIFILIGLEFAAIIGAFLIDSHPVFFIASLFILVVLGVITPHLGAAYTDFAGTDDYSNYSAQFVMSKYIMEHFPFFIVILCGFPILIALYAKATG